MSHLNFRRVQACCRGFLFGNMTILAVRSTPRRVSSFCGSSKHIQSLDSICVNALELLGMVMSAHMLVVVYGERPVGDKDCVLLRSDNEAAIQWMRRCQGVRSFDRGLSYA